MKKVESLRLETLRVIKKIQKLMSDDSEFDENWNQQFVMMTLEDLVKTCLYKGSEDMQKEMWNILISSPAFSEMKRYIDFKKCREDIEIRKNWYFYLASVKDGCQLSSKIGWGFWDEDIQELARIHRSGKFQKKIEDLLEDCNFHYEREDFIEGRYDLYLGTDA